MSEGPHPLPGRSGDAERGFGDRAVADPVGAVLVSGQRDGAEADPIRLVRRPGALSPRAQAAAAEQAVVVLVDGVLGSLALPSSLDELHQAGRRVARPPVVLTSESGLVPDLPVADAIGLWVTVACAEVAPVDAAMGLVARPSAGEFMYST
jgi:hypothetical protein